jgi:hypothetical protein
LLLYEFCDCGLSGGYVNWFRRYLIYNLKSPVFISGILSSPSEVLPGVSLGFFLEPLLFRVLINYLCDAVVHSEYLLFAKDVKIYLAIESPEDGNILQSYIISRQGWCTANCIKLKMSETKVTSFSRKTNELNYNYQFCHFFITRAKSIKDLGIFIGTKLRFRNHLNHIFSCFKLRCLVRSITFTYSSLKCMHGLYSSIKLDLRLNTSPLSRIQLQYLIPTSWNTSSRGLRPSV